MKKHQVFLISCMQPAGVQFAKQWLYEHDLDGDSFASVGVGGNKKRILQHGFRVYADDNPALLEDLVNTVPHLFLFDTPYNRDLDVHPRVIRVRDWQELTDRLQEIGYAEERFDRVFSV